MLSEINYGLMLTDPITPTGLAGLLLRGSRPGRLASCPVLVSLLIRSGQNSLPLWAVSLFWFF
jgi:hypothetical protein